MKTTSQKPGKEPPIISAVRLLDRGVASLTTLMAYVGIGALTAAIVVVVLDIAWRRIGGGSFIGAVDLTQFSVVAAASWAIPYAFSAMRMFQLTYYMTIFQVPLRAPWMPLRL